MASDSEEVTDLSRNGSTEHLPFDDCPTLDSVFLCQICNGRYRIPRVLSCLHVFCTPCLDRQVEIGPEGMAVICLTCKQTTKLTSGVSDLLIDAVIVNMMEMADIQTRMVLCTSCKAEEKAVARCSDCSSFLCPSCVTAHNYMRCFENHKVVSFEEICKDENQSLHKPMFCHRHSAEGLKYFCTSCEVPVCTECMVSLHKMPDHHLEMIGSLDRKYVEELNEIVWDAKGKMEACDCVSGNLENLLSELQLQRDNASDLINESFQSYKVALEKCKDDLLKDLESIHSSAELKIMDLFHSVEKTSESLGDGCKFAERIVKNGNAIEVLTMKKLVRQRLLLLLDSIPSADLSVKIEFVTDADRFKTAMRDAFGHFKNSGEQEKKTSECLLSSSVHSSIEGDNFGLLSTVPRPLGVSDSLFTPLIPDFLPGLTSLPALNTSPISDLTSSIITSLSGMSIGGALGGPSPALPSHPYSVERSLSRNSYSPAISDSGIVADAGGTNASGQSLLNLQALLTMGNLGLNSQGQITVNGQIFPSLNLNSSVGVNPPLASNPSLPPHVHIPMQSVPDQALTGLFNTNPLLPTTPLSEISALFNSLPSHQPPISSLRPVRAASPVSAAVAAANLLGPPPALLPLNGGLPGTVGGLQARSSSKISSMDIRCKFGQLGPGKGQFNSPHGFCLGVDEDIVVADTNNHRIQVFEKNGEFKYQFGVPGREEGQLWYPRKVAVIRTSGKYVVCDRGSERSRMQLFMKNGQFIKKIAIRYVDIVAGLAITSQGHILAVDSVSPTVFCISENGDLIKWFDCSDYMREPSDIAVHGKDYYVCDFKGHSVVVFNEEGQFLHRIGCENITSYPNGIDISDAGDVLIGDSHGNRFHIAVFQRDGRLIGEFECPYIKVSRCCGLKITSEGYVVTLAKNNQHVLVLNTLYIA